MKIGGIQISQRVQIDRATAVSAVRAVIGEPVIEAIVVVIVVVCIGIHVRLKLNSRASGRINAQSTTFGFGDLHYRDVDHHFRLRSIEILDEFCCQRNLIRAATHYNRAFRRQRLNAGNLEDLPQCIHDILQFGGLR